MKKIKFTALILGKFIIRYARKVSFRASLSKNLSGIGGVNISSKKGSTNKSSKALHIAQQRYFILAVLILLFLGFLLGVSSRVQNKNSISEGVVGIYTESNLPDIVTNLLSESLVSLDKSGKPQPKLAESWSIDEKATVYTFKLRKDMKWNDGTELRSYDLEFNLPDVEISYPDSKTVIFKLADSFTPFPTLLTDPVFKNKSLVGAGKYKIAQREFSQSLITKLVLIPALKKDGSLPVIIVRFYPDEKIAKTAFELGEVESLVGVFEEKGLAGQPTIGIKKITNFNKIVAIFYNTKDAILSDKNMRRALGFASPKFNGEELARTPIPSTSWVFNDKLRDYTGDQEAAKTSLGKVATGSSSTINLTTIPALSQIGEKVIQSWKRVGISATLKVESGVPQNFQALLIPQSIPSDPDQYALWHSTQEITNLSRYSSPRVDKDLEDGRKTKELEIRKEKYLDFQKVLLEDAPATFLYFPKTQVIYRLKSEAILNKVLPLQIPQL